MLLSIGTFALAQDDTSSEAARQQNKQSDAARAAEESSSKDTRVDLSPPKDDEKNHPLSSVPSTDDNNAASDVQEMHPWDPHKAAKDVEVGDFYFKQKNYKAAIARYKDALIYKSNDAIAEYRLAESLDKSGSGQEAIPHYQAYLKILPHGPDAENAQKALTRLNAEQSKSNSAAK
jgi:tetratricopeptide (TPR) repeat protein